MLRRIWATVIGLVVAGVGFVPAQAVQRDDTGRTSHQVASKSQTDSVKLGSTNLLSGAQAGFVTIRIPKSVSLSGEQGSNPDFEVRGDGLFGGFFLQRDDSSGSVALLGGRLPSGGAFGPPGQKEILLPFVGGFEDDYVLDAGDYRLYLIADGPTRVTIRLEGLRGVQRLHPDHETSIDAKKLPVRTAVEGQTNFYSADGVSELKGDGLILQYLSIKSNAWAAGEFGNCTSQGESGEPQALAWLPFCPLADNAVITSFQDAFVRPSESRTSFYNATLGLPAGRYTASTWYEAAALVEEADAIGVWLSLN